MIVIIIVIWLDRCNDLLPLCVQEKLLKKLRGEENGLVRQLDELAGRLEAKMEARLSTLESALRERGTQGPMCPMCPFSCV